MRTRATIAGNICNASPIADITCLLLAAEAELSLSHGGRRRMMPLKDFYLGYKTLNKQAEEVVEEVRFPVLGANEKINWEKVSKRAWLDIATVNSALKLGLDGGQIQHAQLALGGVAATPKLLEQASAYLVGKPVSVATAVACAELALCEFEPISDVRGSARYKKLLARQLILAHFEKLFPETIQPEALDAALR